MQYSRWILFRKFGKLGIADLSRALRKDSALQFVESGPLSLAASVSGLLVHVCLNEESFVLQESKALALEHGANHPNFEQIKEANARIEIDIDFFEQDTGSLGDALPTIALMEHNLLTMVRGFLFDNELACFLEDLPAGEESEELSGWL